MSKRLRQVFSDWLAFKRPPAVETGPQAIVSEVFLDKNDVETYMTATVMMLDDSEDPTTFSKVPIETAGIPRLQQRVQLSKRDDPGGEIPYAITSLVLDDVFRPPQVEDFGSAVDPFQAGDKILFSDTSAVIVRQSGKIELLNQKGIIEVLDKSLRLQGGDQEIGVEDGKVTVGKNATEKAVLGDKLQTAWANSVDAALQALLGWSKTGIAPGPAGGITPLVPPSHSNFNAGTILSGVVKIK